MCESCKIIKRLGFNALTGLTWIILFINAVAVINLSLLVQAEESNYLLTDVDNFIELRPF